MVGDLIFALRSLWGVLLGVNFLPPSLSQTYSYGCDGRDDQREKQAQAWL